MTELLLILLGGVFMLLLFNKKGIDNSKQTFKNIAESFKQFKITKKKAEKKLEEKKDEIKKMSNTELANDVNDKLAKFRNHNS